MSASSIAGRAFVKLVQWLVILVLLFPIIALIAMSVNSGRSLQFPPQGFSLKWYSAMFSSSQFQSGITASLALAATAAIISVTVGLFGAYVIVRHLRRGRKLIEFMVLSPIIIPEIATASGLFALFRATGLLSDSVFTLIVGYVIVTFPYTLRTLIATFYGMDRSVEEASMILGADRIQTFTGVVLPLLRPGIIVSMIFAFVISFNDLPMSIFLSSQYTFTLPVVILGYAINNVSPVIASASALLTVFAFAMMALIEKSIGLDKMIGIVPGLE